VVFFFLSPSQGLRLIFFFRSAIPPPCFLKSFQTVYGCGKTFFCLPPLDRNGSGLFRRVPLFESRLYSMGDPKISVKMSISRCPFVRTNTTNAPLSAGFSLWMVRRLYSITSPPFDKTLHSPPPPPRASFDLACTLNRWYSAHQIFPSTLASGFFFAHKPGPLVFPPAKVFSFHSTDPTLQVPCCVLRTTADLSPLP